MSAASNRVGDVTKTALLATLDDIVAETGVAGAQLSIAIDSEQVDVASGLSNAKRGTSMALDTLVAIGSITKVLNAALIVSLAECGDLSLDRPISTFAPSVQLAGEAQHRLTLRQLLSMSAGLDNGPYSVRRGGPDTLAAYVHSLGDIELLYEPGEGFGYSNAGSCIAGHCAQFALGRSWEELLRSRLLLVLGLDEWALGIDELAFHHLSVGHLPTRENCNGGDLIRPWGFSQAQSPAGSSLAMSMRSLAHFGRLLASGGTDNRPGPITKTVVAKMTTPTARVPSAIPTMGIGDVWGLGPSGAQWRDQRVWCHAGGMQSARTFLAWLPALRGVVAFAVNTPARFDSFASQVAERIVGPAFGVAPEPRRQNLKNPNLSTLELERYVGAYGRFGTRYELSVRGGRLHYEEINLGIHLPGEHIGVSVSSYCDCVDADRFVFSMPEFAEPLPLVFQGRDARGRATSMVSTIFPARRLENVR